MRSNTDGSSGFRVEKIGKLIGLLVAVAMIPLAGVLQKSTSGAAAPDARPAELFDSVKVGTEILAAENGGSAGSGARSRSGNAAAPVNLVPEIARRNNQSEADTREILADRTSRLDKRGYIHFVDPAPSSETARGEVPRLPDGALPVVGEQVTPEIPATYIGNVLNLHSNPNASKVVMLDFDGITLTNTGWNSYYNKPEIVTKAYSLDSDFSSYSVIEEQAIQRMWAQVAEDYAALDVDVTTENLTDDRLFRNSDTDTQYGVRVIITGETNAEFGDPDAGGRAWVGGLDQPPGIQQFYADGWVYGGSFIEVPGSVTPQGRTTAEAISHEAGHLLGLSHDGTIAQSEYNYGNDGWAPVMGVGYYQRLTQFSNGGYPNASNTEDDYAILADSNIGLRSDDHADTASGATPLGRGPGTRGLMNSQSDVDSFTFEATEGQLITLAAGLPNLYPIGPDTPYGAYYDQNAHLQMEVIAPSGGTFISTPEWTQSFEEINADSENIRADLDPRLTFTAQESGLYTVLLRGISQSEAIYNDYGSVGRYVIEVTSPNPPSTTSTTTTSTTLPASTSTTSTTTSTTTTSTTTTSTTTTSTTTSVPGSSACRAQAVRTQWYNGYGISVLVTNTGSGSLSDWIVEATLPDGDTVTTKDTGVSVSGNTVTVVPTQDWQQNIPSGTERWVAWFNVETNSDRSEGLTLRCEKQGPRPTTTSTTQPSTTQPVTTQPVTTQPVTTQPPTTQPPTTQPSSSRPPTSSKNKKCRATAKVSPYYDGYGVELEVTNLGSRSLIDWKVEATLPEGQSYLFGSTNITVAGSKLTVQSLEDWQRNLASQETRVVAWFHIATNTKNSAPDVPTFSCRRFRNGTEIEESD